MAGFGRNGSRSSAKAIASAERHGVWIALRRQGHLEKDIARGYGVSQQAVSKVLLKYVRDVPASEAELLRIDRAAQIALMFKMANQASERAHSDKVLLEFISIALDLMEREAKLLGLDAKTRSRGEPPPDRSHAQPTVWSLVAQVGPTDLETLKRIQELDPIQKPVGADAFDEDSQSITDNSSDGDSGCTTDALSELESYSLEHTQGDAPRSKAHRLIQVR